MFIVGLLYDILVTNLHFVYSQGTGRPADTGINSPLHFTNHEASPVDVRWRVEDCVFEGFSSGVPVVFA